MRIGRKNRSAWRKSAPAPLSPPQIPQGITWDRTRPSAVGSRRLTAWDMARPCVLHSGGVFRPVTWAAWVCTIKNHAVHFLDLRWHCFVIKMEPVLSGTWKNLSRDLSPLREQYGPCYNQSGLHASTLSLPMHLPLFHANTRSNGLKACDTSSTVCNKSFYFLNPFFCCCIKCTEWTNVGVSLCQKPLYGFSLKFSWGI
jgi:hypothetical protein